MIEYFNFGYDIDVLYGRYIKAAQLFWLEDQWVENCKKETIELAWQHEGTNELAEFIYKLDNIFRGGEELLYGTIWLHNECWVEVRSATDLESGAEYLAMELKCAPSIPKHLKPRRIDS